MVEGSKVERKEIAGADRRRERHQTGVVERVERKKKSVFRTEGSFFLLTYPLMGDPILPILRKREYVI